MTIKNLEKLCDREWSKRVRERDKICRICGNKHNLDPHHIFSRRHLATRWELGNGVLLCREHHREAHRYGTLYPAYMIDNGSGWGHLPDLCAKHNEIFKPTREWLENKLKELEES